MNNDEFRKIWAMLNRAYQERASGMPLSSLNAVGICAFAEKVRADLDGFISEVIARAKAADENAASMAEHNRKEFGERYEKAIPEYQYGLDFAHKEPI